MPAPRPSPLPFTWPRVADDGTPLGVDLAAPSRHKGSATVADDVRRIVLKHFHPADVDPEDLVGEVYAAICRKNRQGCAFDPRRAGLSKYVWRVAYGVTSNMLAAGRRWTDVIDGRPELGDPSGGDDDDSVSGWAVAASYCPEMEEALDMVRPAPPEAPWTPPPLEVTPPPLWQVALADRAHQARPPGSWGQLPLWSAWRVWPWRPVAARRRRGASLRLIHGGGGAQRELFAGAGAGAPARAGERRRVA